MASSLKSARANRRWPPNNRSKLFTPNSVEENAVAFSLAAREGIQRKPATQSRLIEEDLSAVFEVRVTGTKLRKSQFKYLTAQKTFLHANFSLSLNASIVIATIRRFGQ